MRLVAVILSVLLTAVAAVEAAPDRLNLNDDCYNEVTPTGAGASCLRIGAGAVPSQVSPSSGNLFLWLGAVDCGASVNCITTPGSSQSRNVVTGQGAIYGLLYADNNGLAGLQRTSGAYGGQFRQADSVILV